MLHEHLPIDSGDTVCRPVLAAPALCPKMVTRLGLPPKYAMFSWTHCRPSTWSKRPLLPGLVSSSVLRKPEPKLQPFKHLTSVYKIYVFSG